LLCTNCVLNVRACCCTVCTCCGEVMDGNVGMGIERLPSWWQRAYVCTQHSRGAALGERWSFRPDTLILTAPHCAHRWHDDASCGMCARQAHVCIGGRTGRATEAPHCAHRWHDDASCGMCARQAHVCIGGRTGRATELCGVYLLFVEKSHTHTHEHSHPCVCAKI